MHRRWGVLATALLLAFGPARGGTPSGNESAERTGDRLLAALHRANGVPGMGAAVVHGHRLLWTGSAGARDLEAGTPVDPATVFRLASVSKLVTATAAARLVERGLLDVDAPVQSLLPWLETSWAPLTSRQLAAHLSGLPHYEDADRGRGGTHHAHVRDAVGLFANRPLTSAPGSTYLYSSWGYTLLSAVVEARAQRPFLEYLADEVTPGLEIGPDRTDAGLPSAARAYGFANGVAARLPAHDFSYTWGGGGLAATPEAIARFGGRVLAGEVVSRSTFEWMLSPAMKRDGTPAGERGFDTGFGWRTGKDEHGRRVAHHAGVTDGARSALVVWPETGVSASLLSNASWVSSIEQTTMVLAAVFEPASDTTGPPRPCPVDAATYEAIFADERFEGRVAFSIRNGICEGRIELPAGSLRSWLDGFPQRDARSLEVIGFDGAGGLGRAALVTPIGLHHLHATEGPGGFRATLASAKVLHLAFR